MPDSDLIGLIRQPKYGHLKELHKAIKLCERALLSADPAETSLGTYAKVCHHFYSEATSMASDSVFVWFKFSKS